MLRNTSSTKLSKGKRFTELLVEQGHRMEKRLLGAEMVNTEADAELLELFGESCQRIERLYMLDEQPYIHFQHYITPDVALVQAENDKGALFSSLYEWLKEKEIMLENFHDRFLVEAASAESAAVLGLEPGAPVLKRLRRSYDSEGNLIEFSIGIYNTQLHPYLVSYDA